MGRLLNITFFIIAIYFNCYTKLISAEPIFKVCAIQDTVPRSICDGLNNDGSAVCVPAVDSVDCALKLNRGDVNVAKFTAEQALLVATSLHNDSSVVVASVKHNDKLNETFAFQTVVVVSKDFEEGNLNKLSGKRFCHPGFKFEETWSRRVLTEFEHKVVPRKCGPSDSYAIEDEFNSLAKYFGKSCRPGVWVPSNSTIDKELKQKYKSLCELCDNQEACEYMSSDKNPHLHALRCLTQLNGEVAYVSLEHAKNYFGVTGHQVKEADADNYRFLCPDGTLQTIATANPCTWVKQPWAVVVTRREVEQPFKHEILDAKLERYSANWKEFLLKVLVPANHDLVEIKINSGLVSYLEKGRIIPKPEKDKCRNNLRWCTTDLYEESKCKWLSLAILTAGIRPGLECVKGTSVLNCFSHIRSGRADLISIDSNYGYIARKNFKLAPVYYSENKGDKSLVLAVIKSEDATRFTKFSDLRGKNVCMPEYGGIAYVSAIAFGRSNNTLKDKNCDYGAALSNFFENGCVPGARDSDHGVTKGTNADKLCALCQVTEYSKSSTTCDADQTNRYYGDLGALECLSRGNGDIAFVEKSLVQSNMENATKYRVLCRNNTLHPLVGFDVNEECALSATIDSETITRNVDANKPAYELFLSDLEEAFREINVIKHSTFNMFASFDGRSDVMFKNNTIGFDRTDNPNNKYARNYKQLFKEIDDCTFGGSSALLASHILLLLCGILIIFYNV